MSITDIEQCHVPNFSLGHNGLITFSIFMRVCQIDAKGQIIAKEEITSFLGWGWKLWDLE